MLGLFQIGLFSIGQISDPSTIPLEANWHYGYSEPVRFKIVPRHRVALIASGPYAPVLNPDNQIVNNLESRWHYPWSEPIRLNLKHPLRVAHQKAWFGPDRYLPRPDVTVRISATEPPPTDTVEIEVFVYDNLPIPYERFATADVSITEIEPQAAVISIKNNIDPEGL